MPIIASDPQLFPLALYVSDGSGASAEAYGEAILSQMGPENFRRERAVFCKTPEMARQAGQLAMDERLKGRKVCVFSTLALPESRAALKSAFPDSIDLFDVILPLASHSLQMEAKPRLGASHGAYDAAAKAMRADAIDYALSRDDGARADYADAQIILVGVSRSGKTPCCMWLAMHYGLRAANYPLTEEDLEPSQWPQALRGLESLCAGLTLSPARLAEIRHARLRHSRYASTETCSKEIGQALSMMRARSIPWVDTTGQGVEEICAALIASKDLHPSLSF
jgi:regulator of PEP synthase PpsR (kinase-PPPase family)